MSGHCTDYYIDENGDISEKHVYPKIESESYTNREAEWVRNSSRVIYSVVSTGMTLKIYWDSNQYSFKRIEELPKELQMKILIGAV